MAILARPDHVIEANFFSTNDGSVWSDLSGYIELQQGIKAGKRRQTVFDNVAPATFSATFDNSAGTFNDDRTDSPFYGLVTVDTPVRFRLRWPNVPTVTNNMLSDYQSLASDPTVFTADQGSLSLDITTSAVTVDDTDGSIVYTGTWGTYSSAGFYNGTEQSCSASGGTASFTFTGTYIEWHGDKASNRGIASVTIDGVSRGNVDCYAAVEAQNSTLFTASGLSPGQHTITITNTGTKNASSSGTFIDVDCFVFSATSTPPTGQTADLVWSTGVIDQTGVAVFTGNGPSRAPDDQPVYVQPSTTYSARVQVKCDTAGTGISFAVKARIRWFDVAGNLISDTDSASATTLTTAYQAVTVSGTSPSNAASARLGIVAQTAVAPATRAITFDGSDVETQHWGTKMSITVPASVDVGDFLNVFVRTNNATATVSAPTGWTFKTSWSDSKGKTSWWYKVATATDISKRYTFSTNVNCGFQVLITAYTGVSQTTLIHQYSTATESTYRTTHTTPSVTTTIANCLICSAAFDVSSTTTSWGAPAGENVRAVVYRTGGNSPTGVVTDNATQVAAGTYGSKVFTANSSSRYASMATFALAPASGTGPGNVNVQMGSWELVAGSLGTWAQGGHWENKFTGLADSWTEVFDGDLVMTTVAATDRQKILTAINIGAAVYESIRSYNPVAYYKLDESGSGTNAVQEAANSADTQQPTMVQKQYGTGGAINWGQGTGPGVDGSSALQLAPVDRSNGIGLTTVFSNPIVNANAISMSEFWNSTVNDTVTHVLQYLQDPSNGTSPRGYFQVVGTPGASGSLYAEASIASEAGNVTVRATKTGQYFDGATHHIAATAALVGGQLIVTLFIDGTQAVQATSACSVAQFPTLSIASVGCQNRSAYITGGTYSHAAWFNWALDSDTVSDIYTAGTTAFAGDTIDQRISRLADWENQDNLTIDATTTVAARHMPDSQTLLAAFQQASISEGGTIYIGGDGDIVFRSRVDKESISVPLITVKASQVDANTFAKVTDDTLLVNKAVIKRLSTGVTTSVSNQASIAIHGVHEKDIDTILSSNDDALNYATYLMAFYHEAQPRCDQVTTRPVFPSTWTLTALSGGGAFGYTYFICQDYEGAKIGVGDTFTWSGQPGTTFTVTASAPPSGGQAAVSYTPASTSAMNSGTVTIGNSWMAVIQVDIWALLRITTMPSTEASSTIDLFIEGWEIDIDHDNWTMVFDTSTAIPFLVLNDATRGVCGAAVVAW